MRKNYQMWLLGALFGGLVLPFAGCSNEDDPISNESGNGETFETELTIALKTGNGTKTRATNEETQNDANSFNGMTDIRLVSYGGEFGSGGNLSDLNYAPNSDATNNIISVTALTDLSSSQTILDNNYFRQKDNIQLKQETQAFLFYGKSSCAGVGDIATNISTTGTVSTINFNLVPKTQPGAAIYEDGMQTYLAGVYKALYDFNPVYLTGEGTASGGGIDATKFYNNLKLAKSGAFDQIAYLMAQIYVLAENGGFAAADQGSVGSLEIIKEAIFKDDNKVIFNTAPAGNYDGGSISITNFDLVTDGLATALDASNLPTVYKLKFYDFKNINSEKEGILTFDETNDYAYPAALYYYVNTYPVDYTSLGGVSDYTDLDWVNGILTESTTAANLKAGVPNKIAMAHTAQYAVGRLDVTIADGTESGTASIPDGGSTTINFSDLTLQAILIGNQKQVGWNFLPTTSPDEMVIYDNEFGGNDGKTNACQVLALPSEAGEPVNIALEMKNGGTSFIGKGGQIIPANSKFYLTAQLNPKTPFQNNTGIANPAVFMSDYNTTVTLKLKTLVNAENTVPDLSGSSLEFALSVDLSWNQGLVFEETIE